MTNALASSYLSSVFTDDKVADILSDRFMVRAMLIVEGSLADAQGQLGIIPAEAAARISLTARQLPLEPSVLGGGMIRDGVPIPALIDILREALPPEAAPFVHYGATSQDIMDTATVLQHRAIITLIEERLKTMVDRLGDLASQHQDSLMLARTHGQAAAPTTFGYKCILWRDALTRQQQRLSELKDRCLALQFGGAAGTQAAYGEQAQALAEKVAELLKLKNPLLPWHSSRDRFVELGSWMTTTTGALAKIAQDILLLSQSEIAEVAEGAGGGSSSMPHKSNPMLSEAIVALARHSANQMSGLHQAMIADHERATHAWQLEWMTLPEIIQGAGAALKLGDRLIATLRVNPDRMARNLTDQQGFVLAEAASMALAQLMPLPEAQKLVREAVKAAKSADKGLFDILPSMSDAAINWDQIADPSRALGQAQTLTKRALIKGV